MTRKSRVFSALAISAAGALMITTTAYQSKAADGVLNGNYHIDEGTGYASEEVTAVAGLKTTSTGTFRYDAPGTDDDIEIASGDIKSLEDAIKALSSQVIMLGDTAKAADMALDSSTSTAIETASTANTTALSGLSTANSTAIGNVKNSIDALTAKVNTLNDTIISKDFGGGSAGITTALGNASTDVFCLTAAQIAMYFPYYTGDNQVERTVSNGYGGTAVDVNWGGELPKYLIWSGVKTASQIKTNPTSGFLGRLACCNYNSGNGNYYVYYFNTTTLQGTGWVSWNTIYTLAPIVP